MRQHHLENVTSPDIFLGLVDHVIKPGFIHADLRIGQGIGHGFGTAIDEQIALELHDHVIEPCTGQIISRIGINAVFRADRGDDGYGIFDGVKACRDGRANENAIRYAKFILVAVWQLFHQTHCVIAHIANQTGTHRRQVVGQFDMAFGNQLFQAFKRGFGFVDEGVGISHRTAVQFGLVAKTPPDQVGFKAQKRIPTANSAAFNRFKQIGIGHAFGDLEESRNRRIQICCQRGPENLRDAVIVILLEAVEIRFDFHGLSKCWSWS